LQANAIELGAATCKLMRFDGVQCRRQTTKVEEHNHKEREGLK